MKVRFAPSPTGLLHVGNTRTALANFLFARRTSARFLLRIDDTDAERSRPELADAIRHDLAWLGIEWDETFRQSDRLDRYAAAAGEVEGLRAAVSMLRKRGRTAGEARPAHQARAAAGV